MSKQPSVETKIVTRKNVMARVRNSDIGELTDWINSLLHNQKIDLSTQQAQMRDKIQGLEKNITGDYGWDKPYRKAITDVLALFDKGGE